MRCISTGRDTTAQTRFSAVRQVGVGATPSNELLLNLRKIHLKHLSRWIKDAVYDVYHALKDIRLTLATPATLLPGNYLRLSRGHQLPSPSLHRSKSRHRRRVEFQCIGSCPSDASVSSDGPVRRCSATYLDSTERAVEVLLSEDAVGDVMVVDDVADPPDSFAAHISINSILCTLLKSQLTECSDTYQSSRRCC